MGCGCSNVFGCVYKAVDVCLFETLSMRNISRTCSVIKQSNCSIVSSPCQFQKNLYNGTTVVQRYLAGVFEICVFVPGVESSDHGAHTGTDGP